MIKHTTNSRIEAKELREDIFDYLRVVIQLALESITLQILQIEDSFRNEEDRLNHETQMDALKIKK